MRCFFIYLKKGRRIGLVFIYNRTKYVSLKKVLYLQSVISILAPVGAIHSCLYFWQPTGPWQCRSYMGIPPRVTIAHPRLESSAPPPPARRLDMSRKRRRHLHLSRNDSHKALFQSLLPTPLCPHPKCQMGFPTDVKILLI